MSEKHWNCLVLAASRGNLDPLARKGGVSHKCFIDIEGEPMLRRVVAAAVGSGRFDRVIVSIEPGSVDEARKHLAGLSGEIEFVPSRSNIAESVFAIASDALLPLAITTGDNALHTEEMMRHFVDEAERARRNGFDAALGLTPASLVLEHYPEGNRAFHRFRDGGYSSCNLYALLTPAGVKGAETFRSGGQFGKKPKRLIGAFGIVAFLLYKSRLLKLSGFLKVLSRAMQLKVAPVLMPFPEGPIDVDREQDWVLAERIIRARDA